MDSVDRADRAERGRARPARRRALLGGFALALSALMLLPDSAIAATFFKCSDPDFTRTTNASQAARWAVTSKEIVVNQSDFPTGEFRRAVNDAIRFWNDAPQNFRFTTKFADQTVALGDKKVSIGFQTQNFRRVCGTVAACAPSIYTCDGITEADVFMNSSVLFSGSSERAMLLGYGGLFQSLRSTIMHELGHAIGLLHTAGRYNLMASNQRHFLSNGIFAYSYVGEDASVGAVALYGKHPRAKPDLSVTHWRSCGNSRMGGTVENHCFNRITRTNGSPFPNAPRISNEAFCGHQCLTERVYDVKRGDTVDVEFTFENSGPETARDVRVAYFFSTDDNITTSDLRFFRTDTFVLTRGAPDHRKIRLTIPPNDVDRKPLVDNRQYFIGAIIDVDGRFAEHDEKNAAYMPVRIVP